ncbi:tegument protein [Macropodid alphaherpesvirus 1]|uniref:Tegument protein n=1 Tax=Macropodid alphaherpesvirus 1 TaxID=137443 RepID=A0A109QLG7_9ALPH|nr:tegument protein [Macropodid alphaherpesvirus 1]AMB17045.1 tegument protein [Macropodid alphaherpesvirus 1]
MDPHPPDDDETAITVLKQALHGNRCLADVAELISSQTLLRLACEIHQIAAHTPRFSASNIIHVHITPCLELRLTLGGGIKDVTVSSKEYLQQCKKQPAYQGMAFAVITATEDRVYDLSIPPMLLQHRFCLFYPSELLDLELAIMLMYLENCPAPHATSSTFVKISAWLGAIERRTPPAHRMRSLLLRSCRWILNTLMHMVSLTPFDKQRVLPHWFMAKQLLVDNPPSIIAALFHPDPAQAFKLPTSNLRTECVVSTADGVLGPIWRSEGFKQSLMYWWLHTTHHQTTDNLFYKVY